MNRNMLDQDVHPEIPIEKVRDLAFVEVANGPGWLESLYRIKDQAAQDAPVIAGFSILCH